MTPDVRECPYREALARVREDIRSTEDAIAQARAALDQAAARLAGLRCVEAALAPLAGEPAPPSPPRPRKSRRAGSTYAEVLVRLARSGRWADGPFSVAGAVVALDDAGELPPGLDARSKASAIQSAITRRPGLFARVARGRWTLAPDAGPAGGGPEGSAQ